MSTADILGFSSQKKKISSTLKQDEALILLDVFFNGYNEDIVEKYHWHINFPYYRYKGYQPLKLEDYHYFSENSQLGQNLRQVKGGSIRAFQENLQQLVQLIKVHMMPLLKEIKEAEFYKKWFDNISDFDSLIQVELKSSNSNKETLEKYRFERNQAINTIKEKWVNDVDGGKMWQYQRSSTEQGLDFALLPQLFFGINLDNPLFELHRKGKSISEQLKDDVYPVDISQDAKEKVGQFMYRFYTWLPSAIKETNVSFRIKVASLKQFYSQLQMYINFMKPLLIEISRKTEGFNRENFYRDFENENPDFVNLFDYSYSFVKVLGIKGFNPNAPGGYDNYKLDNIQLSDRGLFLEGMHGSNEDIIHGKFQGKSGFIVNEKKIGENSYYEFKCCKSKDLSDDDFNKIKSVFIPSNNFKKFQVMEFNFSQRRRTEILETSQGPQQVPFMTNHVRYKGFSWNLFEIATYRESLKEDNLELLETFIEEIKVIKDDLLKYVKEVNFTKSSYEEKKKDLSDKKKDPESLIFSPIKGLGEIFSPLVSSFKFNKKFSNSTDIYGELNEEYVEPFQKKVKKRDGAHEVTEIAIIEDTWKMYTVFKKVNGYIQY